MRTRWLPLALLCAVTVALVSGTEASIAAWGHGLGVSFWRALLIDGPSWIAWALMTPALLAAAARHPLGWPPRRAALGAHLGRLAGATALFALVATVCARLFRPGPPHGTFPAEYGRNLAAWSPLTFVLYAATVAVGRALELGRQARARERRLAALETELARAQLSALRMQLNPHFLFNALHTIAVLVREGSRAQAVDLIARLGDVLRRVLRASTELEAPLGDEIALLRDYLEIEQARFGDRLAVDWRVDDEAAAARVPQLILQPLVENALRHGLAPRAAPGRLTIVAARLDATLVLEVRDDGVGLGAAPDGGGVGLANVRARLAKMYGAAAALTLESPPGGGVHARIVLPHRPASAAATPRLQEATRD